MNCVLSNPFYRIKVIESKLIKDRIASITDRQILMDLFIIVFQKSFSHSSITKYNYPVSKCFIEIGSEDMMELDWIHQLKDLLTLSDDEIHIHFDNVINNKIKLPRRRFMLSYSTEIFSILFMLRLFKYY